MTKLNKIHRINVSFKFSIIIIKAYKEHIYLTELNDSLTELISFIFLS